MNGRDIDAWLKDNIGYGNWTEYVGITQLPYRSFGFLYTQDEMMFALTWL